MNIRKITLLLVMIFISTMLIAQQDNAETTNLQSGQNAISDNGDLNSAQPLTEDNMASQKSLWSKISEVFNSGFGIFLLVLVFVILILVPFIPAIREIVKPKDNLPLYINQEYVRDSRHYEKELLEELKPLISEEQLKKKVDAKFRNNIPVKYYDDYSSSGSTDVNNLLIVNYNFKSGDNVVFRQPIYVKGNAEFGNNSKSAIIISNGDIIMGKNCTVVKWMSSKGDITVGENVTLENRSISDGTLQLTKGCKFKDLFAMPIASHNADFKKDLTSPAAIEISPEDVKEVTQVSDIHWYLSKKFVTIPPYSVINNSMIVKTDLILRKGVIVNGDLKVYGKVTIERDVRIYGEVLSFGDIEIGEDTYVKENLFTQSTIYIKQGVRIGLPGQPKTVVGKKGLSIEKNVIIYGNVLTAGPGVVL